MNYSAGSAALAVGVALALAMPAFAGYTNLNYEIEEEYHPFERNNLVFRPETETRVLDDFFAITNFGFTPDPTQPSNPFSVINPQRSGLSSTDVIPPGGGQFYAFYGLWTDENRDGIVDWSGSESCPATAGSEFCRLEGAELLSFVDPGSHPAYDANERPPADQPDFGYIPWLLNPLYVSGQGSHVWFHDGSLARAITVMTLAEATFAPDPDTGKAYSCRVECLSDVDVYVAQAPGSVAGIYEVLTPYIDEVLPTVGFSTLSLPPGVVQAIDALTAPVNDATGPFVNPPYEDESEPGTRSSTSETGRDAYMEDFHVWFDARAVQVVNAVAGASWGSGPRAPTGTGPSFPPGWVSVSANLGVARDLDGDGFIASASASPTFDGNDFRGSCLPGNDWPNRTTKNLHWRLVPKDGWGPAPVIEYDATGYTNGNYPLLDLIPGIVGPTGRTFTGFDEIDGYSYCYIPDKNVGLHAPGTFYYFPLGAPAFTLIVGDPSDPAGNLTYEVDHLQVTGPFWDIDQVGGWP